MIIKGILLLLFLLITTLIGAGLIIPGGKKLKVQFNNLPVYLIMGIVATSLVIFLFSFVGFPKYICWLGLIGLSLIKLLRYKKKIIIDKKASWEAIVLIGVGMVELSLFSFFQGYTKAGDLNMFGPNAHDAWWHIALQEAIKKEIPPRLLIYSGRTVIGYHYLTDVFWSFASQVSGIEALSIYLNWSPVVLAFLFCATTWLLMQAVIKDKLVANLAYLLVVFGSGLAYIAPFVFEKAQFSPLMFWLDQPPTYLINQQNVLALAVVNVIYLLMYKNKAKNWWRAAILLGSMVGIKVYGFVIVDAGIGLIGAISYLKSKKATYLKIAVGAWGLGMLISLLVGSQNKIPFFWSPGWFIKVMFEASDKLNHDVWELKRQIFAINDNYVRLLIHWAGGLVIFLLGAFGVKIIALLGLISRWLKKSVREGVENQEMFGIWLGVVIFSIGLPLLVLQSGVVWNSIQFMHYGQIAMVILLVVLARSLSKKVQKAGLTVVLVLSLPTTIMICAQNIDKNLYVSYPKTLMSGLKNLNELPEGEIYIAAKELQRLSIVPALAKREVYVADETILSILGINYQERVNELLAIEMGNKSCLENNLFLTVSSATPAGELLMKAEQVAVYRCR